MKQLFSNPYFLVLIGSLSGVALTHGTKLFNKIWNNLKNKFIQTIAVEQENDLFRIVNLFIQENYSNKCLSMVARWDKSIKELKPSYSSDVSSFFFKYHGKRLLFSCNREKMEKMEYNFGMYFSTLKISGFLAKRTIDNLLKEAIIKYAMNRPIGTIGIFAKDGYNGMREINEIRPKPIASLIYKDDKSIKIINDVNQFVSNEDWYLKRGISYKRCYCLLGPPGTGKTSLVLTVAAELRRDVYLLDIGSLTGEDDLIRILRDIPNNVVILIEDIDRSLNKEDLKISISSLLNMFDGPLTKRGMLLFMTTNHIDRIDPAILRDGRIDVKEEIGLASTREVEMYLELFYNTSISLNISIEIAMSSIQEICIRNKYDMDKSLKEIHGLKEKQIKITNGVLHHEIKI